MSSEKHQNDFVFENNPKQGLKQAYLHLEETAEYATDEGFKTSYDEVIEDILETLDEEYQLKDEIDGNKFWRDGGENLSFISMKGRPLESFSTVLYSDHENVRSDDFSLNFNDGRKPRETIG